MYGIPTIQQDLQEEVAYVPMYVYSLLFLHMLLACFLTEEYHVHTYASTRRRFSVHPSLRDKQQQETTS